MNGTVPLEASPFTALASSPSTFSHWKSSSGRLPCHLSTSGGKKLRQRLVVVKLGDVVRICQPVMLRQLHFNRAKAFSAFWYWQCLIKGIFRYVRSELRNAVRNVIFVQPVLQFYSVILFCYINIDQASSSAQSRACSLS